MAKGAQNTVIRVNDVKNSELRTRMLKWFDAARKRDQARSRLKST